MIVIDEQGNYVSLYCEPNPVVPPARIMQMRSMAEAFYQEGAPNAAFMLAAIILQVVQATGKPDFYANTPYGVCPDCGDYEEILYLDDKTYGVCHEHRVYWYLGRVFLPICMVPIKACFSTPNLLTTYTPVPTVQAFPKNACACCGKVHTHTAWCLYAQAIERNHPSVHVCLTDIAIG